MTAIDVWSVYRKYNAGLTLKSLRPERSSPPTDIWAGRFRIGKPLDKGNFLVYDAIDLQTGQEVILKINTKLHIKYLEREIDVLRRQINSHFPAYISDGREQGQQYVVMSKILGWRLSVFLGGSGRPLWQMLDVAAQLLEQLESLHCFGIVHRDINPANVLLDPQGQVHLFDFDLSCVLPRHEPRGPYGNLEYVPPEQIRGGEVKFSTDLYALGITLYHMISGDNPMRSSIDSIVIERQFSSDCLLAITRSMIRGKLAIDAINDAQEQVVAEVAERLHDFFQKMAAKKPGDRYQSAAEAQKDLKPIMTLWEGLAPFEVCWPRVE